ncbi:MAG: carbohydrate ABC transporter permease [Cellulomonadaceae bacterium]|jgi:raffinose/stachyose/melibiose transport system permease protein|nr:carbohydrate ABC transporter permease [Cellulomonadaceae bacterium]
MTTMTVQSAHGADIEVVKNKTPFAWTQPIVYIVAIIAAGAAIIPVLFVVLGGFMRNPQLLTNPAGLPDPWVWMNYSRILWGNLAHRFWGQVVTSTLVAVTTTALVVLLGVSIAYAIGRFKMKRSGALFAMFAAGLMFPASMAILPTWIILINLGLAGHWYGLVLPQVAFAMPTTVVILTPFIRAIPNEMEEAAQLDGAGRTAFFFRILLPLARPGMITVGVLAFVASWNAYLLPLFVLGISPTTGFFSETLPLGVQMFSTQFSNDVTAQMAFTSLAIIPALVFFLTMEKHIVNGLSGAVKG